MNALLHSPTPRRLALQAWKRLAVVLVAMLCGTWGSWGCELWGYACQQHRDCADGQVCTLGYCRAPQPVIDADANEPLEQRPSPFVRQACRCDIPQCNAATAEECKRTDKRCTWANAPEIGGPALCVLDRQALCQNSGGSWQNNRCVCPSDSFLYGETLCLPTSCTIGCNNLQTFHFLKNPEKATARANAIKAALIEYVDNVPQAPLELEFLKNKQVGQLLPVQQRKVEQNKPSRWRVTDHYLLAPLLDKSNAVDTWLVLNGDDATLREIVTAPLQTQYPEIATDEAKILLAAQIKLAPKDLQAAPYAVEIIRTKEEKGLQTNQLFPLWMLLHEAEEYFVTTYKRSTGKPIMFRSMEFINIHE